MVFYKNTENTFRTVFLISAFITLNLVDPAPENTALSHIVPSFFFFVGALERVLFFEPFTWGGIVASVSHDSHASEVVSVVPCALSRSVVASESRVVIVLFVVFKVLFQCFVRHGRKWTRCYFKSEKINY